MESDFMNVQIEKIIRTKRKTIALQMTDNATLIIRVPFYLSKEKVKEVILKHKNWIEKKKKEIEKRDPKYSPKEFINGEGFLYLGRFYKLRIVANQSEPLKFNNEFYLSKYALSKAKEVFINWYKDTAYKKISERVEWYVKRRGFKYKSIKITDAQKRWASCSTKGNLNFSWRLIMAPLPVIDYVVVHELVHLEERSHSKSFWIKVKMLMPDYEKHKDWLKNNGYLLKL